MNWQMIFGKKINVKRFQTKEQMTKQKSTKIKNEKRVSEIIMKILKQKT